MAGRQANPMGHGVASQDAGLTTALGWDPASAQAQPGKPQACPSSSNSCPLPSLLGHRWLFLLWESQGASGWVMLGRVLRKQAGYRAHAP